MRNKVVLKGCKPDIIMHNLKAFGIFRILTEQKDPSVMAWWSNDEFIVDTELDKDELVKFFCNDYEPTPLISPWNRSSGFDEKNETALKITTSTNPRLAQYKQVIKVANEVIKDLFGYDVGCKMPKEIKKSMNNDKRALIAELRNRLPETGNAQSLRSGSVISWIDAACATRADNITFGPILLTGGNDGRFEVSSNFMKTVIEHITSDGSKEEDLVRNSLFGTLPVKLEKNTIGPFLPGAYAGVAVNPTGEDKYTLSNPWDYMLAMEGVTFFAGSIYRRGEREKAAFPFSMKSSHAGYNTACDEGKKDIGEIWIPMWDNPATYDEIAYVFAEGRVQATKKPIRGAEFATALANFGAMRGISAFQRFGVLKRKGDAHHITCIGRIRSVESSGKKVLLDIKWAEVEAWLDMIRKQNRLPRFMNTLLRMTDEKVIRYCESKDPRYLQDTLVLIGRIERQLALSPRLGIHPLNRLSKEWIKNCKSDTPEFRLAAALGSINSANFDYPIRCNLEPVELTEPKERQKLARWKSKSRSTIWGRGDLMHNMISVLERRCTDGLAHSGSIPMTAHVYARIDDIVQFIEGEVNDSMIYDLILPLSIIDYRGDDNVESNKREKIPNSVPEPYTCIKSNFPPIPTTQSRFSHSNQRSMFESTVIGLLKSGRLDRALDIMRRRLKISGYETVTYGITNARNDLKPATLIRLCAALLFPIHQNDMKELLDRLRPNSRDYS